MHVTAPADAPVLGSAPHRSQDGPQQVHFLISTIFQISVGILRHIKAAPFCCLSSFVWYGSALSCFFRSAWSSTSRPEKNINFPPLQLGLEWTGSKGHPPWHDRVPLDDAS